MFSQQPLISQHRSTHTLDCQWTTAKIDSVTGIFVKSTCLLPARNSSNKSLPQFERPPRGLGLRIPSIVPWDSESVRPPGNGQLGTARPVSQHQQANTSYRSELGRSVSALLVTQTVTSITVRRWQIKVSGLWPTSAGKRFYLRQLVTSRDLFTGECLLRFIDGSTVSVEKTQSGGAPFFGLLA